MQQNLEPVARELSKETGRLKARLGARKLRRARAEPVAGRDGPDPEPARDEELSAGPDLEIDLLWPDGRPAAGPVLEPHVAADLGLENVVRAMATGSSHEHLEQLTRMLCELSDDPDVLRYRQDILADLIEHPALAAGFRSLMPAIDRLGQYTLTSKEMPYLFQVTWWLGELETYVECIRLAGGFLRQVEGGPSSAGLRALWQRIAAVEQDPAFERLAAELPALLDQIRGVASITVGINLDLDLRPVAATLLAINDERFSEAPLLKMLTDSTGEYESVMPLHSVAGLDGQGAPAGRLRPNPLMIPLFRDLSQVMEQVSRPVAQALAKYVHLNTRFLARLRPALAFYCGALQMIERLAAGGLAMTRPEIAPGDERVCEVRASYNANLALHLLDSGQANLAGLVVTNDIALNDTGRIAVLTGPNQGGKTTYVQSIGLIQVLAQAGLWVPGTTARLSPADGVHTHFPVEEELLAGRGRFGDEARRVEDIFHRATRHSLVLLNESLSGTHAGESLHLARDIVRVWRRLGARVVFATHLHELADQVDDINRETAGDSPVVSLVSSLIDAETISRGTTEVATRRTYKVTRSPSMGRSYARELAMLYGISFEQLVDMLEARGVL